MFLADKADRRTYLKALFGGGLGLLLAACNKKNSDASQSSSSGVRVAPTGTQAPPLATNSSNTTSTTTQTQDCQSAQINLADISQNATPNLRTLCTFYGDSTSALMVVNLPDYQHGILETITVMLLPSGRVVAQKGIFPNSDVRLNTTVRALTFENIRIKADTQVALVFKLSCTSCDPLLKFGPISITFNNLFLGKTAYGLSSSSLPSISGSSTPLPYSTNQAMPLFSPIIKEGTIITQNRISSVDPNSIQFQASGFESLYVTDLVGNILSLPGSPFTQILEYPEFICYKLVQNMYYVRTFVRVY